MLVSFPPFGNFTILHNCCYVWLSDVGVVGYFLTLLCNEDFLGETKCSDKSEGCGRKLQFPAARGFSFCPWLIVMDNFENKLM